jgi:peptidoglycan/xylan/chitin deacetylase (PgdA/CDA1 family)
MKKIRYKIENESGLVKYTFDFIFDILGVSGEEITFISNSEQIDLYYGNNYHSLDCKIIVPKKESDIIWKEILEGNTSAEDIDTIVPFDIINAMACFLTDKVNTCSPTGSYDVHDRLRFQKSFQARMNIAHIPIVNLYVLFLKSLFEKKFSLSGIPLWPEKKRCAIGLSHDVDTPDRYAILRNIHFPRKKKLKEIISYYALVARKYPRYLICNNHDDFGLFDEIMEEERKYHYKSTFFFASMNRFGDWGSIDVLYDINRPYFKKIFKDIIDNGFEIGLHASYNAHKKIGCLIQEKETLSETAKIEVGGLRHHYWHLGKDKEKVLKMHEDAGFAYDSSIAFNEELGFRRNVAFPYYPWDSKNMQKINCLQLPVFCMDGHLFYRPMEIDDAVDRVLKYVETIKHYNGLGIIDWHVRTSYPKNKEFRKWGEAYINIIKKLSKEKDIWVTNLGEIISWWKQREDRISQYQS